MGCTRYQRVVFLWIDREREGLPVEPLARHLQECPECHDHAVRVERLILMLRTRCRRASAPGDLASRIRGRLEFD
jgi:anti-sigma factor (TIGR02949 family)